MRRFEKLDKELLKNPNPSSRVQSQPEPSIIRASARFRVKAADESGLSLGCGDA